MEENENIEKEAYIEGSIENTPLEDAEVDEPQNEAEESISDTENVEKTQAVFEREGWRERVDRFEEEYPLSKELKAEIGNIILEDEHLWEDESCLEKAMLRILCERYMPDEAKARDEDFLQTYIYGNDDIRSRMVDDYMETLDRSRMPSTITRGGRISLARPARPQSIAEAGRIAERIMKR